LPSRTTCYDRHDLSFDGERATERLAKKEEQMDLVSTGVSVGAGSFCCRNCGYVLTLNGLDTLSDCPSCGGSDFARASLFSAQSPSDDQETSRHDGMLSEPAPRDRAAQVASARAHVQQPGEYLCYEEGGELHTVALAREWTRIGRSLAADLRFDDPTVSRRHALIVRQPDGARVLDDRSLNGVFVNGERIEGQLLQDGDEIIVGRYRLSFLVVSPERAAGAAEGADPTALHRAG
jgi:predicted  nucleic acid-binding Zn-ribbon protein